MADGEGARAEIRGALAGPCQYCGLTCGDPDFAPDELQATIERAEQKRLELLYVVQTRQGARHQGQDTRGVAGCGEGLRAVDRAEEVARGRMVIRELVAARSALNKDVLVRERTPHGSGA
jgi:hypothetical protein